MRQLEESGDENFKKKKIPQPTNHKQQKNPDRIFKLQNKKKVSGLVGTLEEGLRRPLFIRMDLAWP